MYINKNLELDKILNRVADYAVLSETKDYVKSLSLLNDKDEIYNALKETDEMRLSIIKLGKFDLIEFNLIDILKRIKSLAPLSIMEIFEVLKLIDNVSRATLYYKKIQGLGIECGTLGQTFETLISLKEIKDEIRKVLDDDGFVLDSASNALSQIRHKIKLDDQRLHQKINQLLSSMSSKMSEPYVTVRGDRTAFPIKAEYKNQIDGIVLGESASGLTIYMDPYSLIEIENKISSLKEEEKREIDRILYALSIKISEYYDQIETDYYHIKYIDFLVSKALYAIDTDSVMPKLSNHLSLINARHPLIAKDKIVPNTIRLDTYKTMIITGPNTGGKTIVLKTVGLLSLMVQSGILIPVDEGSSIPVFKGIYSDIGDEQSIEQSLSTFSSHMTRIVEIINSVEDDSLVLLDELGSGTDPKEGASLAISIIDYLKNYKIYSFITTHYPELKNYAYLDSNIVNASVEFDVDSLKPTFKLLIGFSGKSNALLISDRLGLNKEIIAKAGEISSSLKDSSGILMDTLEKEEERARIERENYEKLTKDFQEFERKSKEEIESEKNKIKKEYDDLNKKKERILEKAQRNADALMKEIIELKKNIESSKADEDIKSVRKKIDDLYESRIVPKIKDDHEINVNDSVKVLEFDRVGTVISIKGDKYTVQLGNFKSTYKKEDLEYVETKNEIKEVRAKSEFKAKAVSSRLDLRGMRYDEAKDALENFIDSVSLERINVVDVIHGYGTLALRKMVSDFASHSPLVKSYRPGDESEGGRGVTVIYLK